MRTEAATRVRRPQPRGPGEPPEEGGAGRTVPWELLERTGSCWHLDFRFQPPKEEFLGFQVSLGHSFSSPRTDTGLTPLPSPQPLYLSSGNSKPWYSGQGGRSGQWGSQETLTQTSN